MKEFKEMQLQMQQYGQDKEVNGAEDESDGFSVDYSDEPESPPPQPEACQCRPSQSRAGRRMARLCQADEARHQAASTPVKTKTQESEPQVDSPFSFTSPGDENTKAEQGGPSSASEDIVFPDLAGVQQKKLRKPALTKTTRRNMRRRLKKRQSSSPPALQSPEVLEWIDDEANEVLEWYAELSTNANPQELADYEDVYDMPDHVNFPNGMNDFEIVNDEPNTKQCLTVGEEMIERDRAAQWEILKPCIPGYYEDKRKREAEQAAHVDKIKHETMLKRLGIIKRIEAERAAATEMKNLDQLMEMAYNEDFVDMLEEMSVEVGKLINPWTDPNQHNVEPFEVLNFLESEVEINAAHAENVEDEFLDCDVEAAADSGAGDHVLADTDAPMHRIEESPGSKAGQNFVGAGGHKMRNQGQVKLAMRADNGRGGRDIRTTFQGARVTRPLMSVSKICDAGMTMKFSSTMAIVEDANGKEVCRFQRKGGLYVAKMKVRNPNYKPPSNQSFGRPGKK